MCLLPVGSRDAKTGYTARGKEDNVPLPGSHPCELTIPGQLYPLPFTPSVVK